jgi:ubiquinone/menaquinone biosynthesis C-methylase UbiE
LIFLDVGCGDGTYELLLEKDFDYLIGLDLTLSNLQMAKAHIKNKRKVDFVLADAKNLPLGDLSADVVLCSEVLEHLDDPLKALLELSRIFRNNLLLTVPVLSLVRSVAKTLHYNRKLEEIETNVGHVSMHNSQWWARTICKVIEERRNKCHMKVNHFYVSAEPFTSIFTHLKNNALLRVINKMLNILERMLSRPMFANHLIITINCDRI